jgi:hypothetical protein
MEHVNDICREVSHQGIQNQKAVFKNGDFTVPYATKAGIKEAVYYNKGFKRQDKPMFGQWTCWKPTKGMTSPTVWRVNCAPNL